MTTFVAHRLTPGTLSARRPADLRTELDQPIAPISDEQQATVRALVEARCGGQAVDVLSMLGLAVTS